MMESSTIIQNNSNEMVQLESIDIALVLVGPLHETSTAILHESQKRRQRLMCIIDEALSIASDDIQLMADF